jgi:hypothetical protein
VVGSSFKSRFAFHPFSVSNLLLDRTSRHIHEGHAEPEPTLRRLLRHKAREEFGAAGFVRGARDRDLERNGEYIAKGEWAIGDQSDTAQREVQDDHADGPIRLVLDGACPRHTHSWVSAMIVVKRGGSSRRHVEIPSCPSAHRKCILKTERRRISAAKFSDRSRMSAMTPTLNKQECRALSTHAL